ncbi:MAG: tyrosine-protein phosphatase [Porphyromonas sp.]|nr:tyrosine-protein phosphatase [Porphyromonas sp.]
MKRDKGIYVVWLLGVCFALMSCARQNYYIDTRMQRSAEGNYVIQWQVNPGMDGHVAIYASQNADKYPDQPQAIEQIAKQVYHYNTTPSSTPSSTPPSTPMQHTYFLLVFNSNEMRVVSNRTIPTVGILNFRDIGGYMTDNNEQVRWGMLYRSGDLWRSFEQDIPTIGSLGIRTQYIMSPSRISEIPPQLGMSAIEQIYVGPEREIDFQHLIDNIYAGNRSRKEIKSMHKELLQNIAFDNPNQLRIILNELTEPGNYPVLLSDDLGKDRVAFVVFLVHHILGVSHSDAINDYVLSNENLPVSRLEPKGFTEPTEVQEALTEYFRCEPNHLNDLISEIQHRFGSISGYLEEFLHFDSKSQQKLRNILLY